jgi:cytochrome c
MTPRRSHIRSTILAGLSLALAAPLVVGIGWFDGHAAASAQASAPRQDVSASAAKPASARAPAGRPDDNRFTANVIAPMGELDEPMAFEVASDGRVYIIERKGGFKVYDTVTKKGQLIDTIPVNTKYVSAAGVSREAEEGLIGFTLDPDFDQNRRVYLLYADPQVAKHVLKRVELRDDTDATGLTLTRIVPDSETIVLEYAVQRETCCHTGGGMTWDARGNLYITVGNNTGNVTMMQSDERPGRAAWDDQRGAANSNDLRGKILRIHPEPDGTYTIPEGNLFPPGTPGTRPEIFVMGTRNAWRVSVDSTTGFLYWGEVGPDAQNDTEIGPRGYDELNQARRPGFFGWPYFIGENHAYPYFDYRLGRPTAPKDPTKPINNSVNNTGLRELPPAQPAFISYPYGPSEKFPELGSGSRSATGGPVYRRADFPKAVRPFPEYCEGKWFAADLARGFIVSIAIDENGNYRSMERFAPHFRWSEIIDMKFGPEGDLYVLDYGSTWFAKSEDSQLVRIEYNGGNRPPTAAITANRTGGVAPFRVAFSSANTKDHDGDTLKYEWTVESAEGGTPRVVRQPNPTIAFDRNGIYTVTLTATDPSGASGTASVDIIAGNEPPAVSLNVAGVNRTFFAPGRPINYSVRVADKEDGAPAADQVAFSIDYVPEGFDASSIPQAQPVDSTTRFAVAKALVAKTDCLICHNQKNRSRGPSFVEMAEKYKTDPDTLDQLAAKVRMGGSGVWGQEVMPPHPLITMHEARTIVQYMLSAKETAVSALPLEGTYTPTVPDDDNGRGSLVLRAVYTDQGARGLPAQTSEATTVLRSPRLGAATADVQKGVTVATGRGTSGGVIPQANGYVAFKNIDLTGIKKAELMAQTVARSGHVGGTVEIRLGSPAGALLGQGTVAMPVEAPRGGGAGRGGRGGRGRGGAPAADPDVNVEAAPVIRVPVAGTPPAGAPLAGAPPAGAPGTSAPVAAAPGAANPPGTAPQAGAQPTGRGRGRGGFGGPTPIGVDLKATTGVHDLYLVFKNEKATPIQPLMTFGSMTLLPQ